MRAQQRRVEQVDHAQASTLHLVFVGRSDPAGGCTDLDAARSIFCRKLDHTVIGKNHLRPIGDEKPAAHIEARLLQPIDFFQERYGIEHDSVADHAAARLPQHATRDELQNKLLAGNDDGVSGIMSAGIARDHIKIFREHIHDLAFTLVAPLGAYYDCCVAFFQPDTPNSDVLKTHTCSSHGAKLS